jgi:acyl phosphate:glycerol-3-phosphate acyltransferase
VPELFLKALLCYLLGSVMGSLLIGRLFGGVDIRTLGSRNAGATNALRTQGKAMGLTVLVIDIAKGWGATALIAPALVPGLALAQADLAPWCMSVCGLAVMLGHVYPLWYGFRGGKGFATLVGVVLGIHAWILVPMLVTWLAALILFGFVGLASILAAVAVAFSMGLIEGPLHTPLLSFGILAALLILYTHRSNLSRMKAGTESRARRVWLFGARRGQT